MDDDDDQKMFNTKMIRKLQLDKFEPNDVPSLQAMIEKAQKFIQKENQARGEIAKKLTERKWDVEYFIPTVKYMKYRRRYGFIRARETDDTRKKIRLLRAALRGHAAYSEDHNEHGGSYRTHMKNLCHHLQHGNNNLVDERGIMKEIQHVKEKPNSEVDKRLHLEKVTHGSKRELRNRLKLALQELDLLTMENQEVRVEEEQFKKELETARNDVRLFRRKLDEINRKKSKLYQHILEVRKQIEEHKEL